MVGMRPKRKGRAGRAAGAQRERGQRLGFGDDFAARARNSRPNGVGRTAAGRPLEQAHPETRLDLADLLAQGRLGDVAPLRRPAEMAGLAEGEGEAHLPEGQVKHNFNLSILC